MALSPSLVIVAVIVQSLPRLAVTAGCEVAIFVTLTTAGLCTMKLALPAGRGMMGRPLD